FADMGCAPAGRAIARADGAAALGVLALARAAALTLGAVFLPRHGRACPGHPRGAVAPSKDVDASRGFFETAGGRGTAFPPRARDKPGHDDIRGRSVR